MRPAAKPVTTLTPLTRFARARVCDHSLHRDDPGGHAGLGFRRLPEPPHTLEVDPETIAAAVSLFERYALGNVSAKDLAEETGLAESRIRMILMNPLYNGGIRRDRGKEEVRRPASWRPNPPVSDELWTRVEEVRRAKTRIVIAEPEIVGVRLTAAAYTHGLALALPALVLGARPAGFEPAT